MSALVLQTNIFLKPALLCASTNDRKRFRPTPRQTFREPERKTEHVFLKPRPVSKFPDRVVRKSVLRTVPTKVRSDVSATKSKVVRPSEKVVRPSEKVVRPSEKVVRSSEKVEEKPAKRAEIVEEKTKQKPNVEKEKEEKSKEAEETVEQGPSDLDDVTKKVLNAEIDAVLDKVWEAVSTKSSSETEKAVTTRFRNESGIKLVQTMANNVAQRLLKVHKPLLVKLACSSLPKQDLFNAFTKKYNCTNVKRVYPSDCTFVARMTNFVDFDRICRLGKTKCGNSLVSISPVYQFTAKPTNFEYVYKTQKTYVDKEKKTEENAEIEKTTDSKNATKLEMATKEKPPGGKVSEAKTIVKNEVNKVENSIESKQSPPTGDKSKVTENNTNVKPEQPSVKDVESQATKTEKQVNNATKKEANKDLQKTNETKNKEAEAEKANETKTLGKPNLSTSAKTPAVDDEKSKPNENKTTNKVTPEKPKPTETKKEVSSQNKSTTAEKVANKPNQAKSSVGKVVTKPKSVQITPKKTAVTDKKPSTAKVQTNVQKSAVKKDVYTKSKASDKIEKDLSDNDELDDYDILAMMSEAIILDECGSDEE